MAPDSVTSALCRASDKSANSSIASNINPKLLTKSGHSNFLAKPVYFDFYPEQGYNSSTGHFVWLVRSPGTVVYHWTFVRHLHYQRSKTCSGHICSLVPTSLINCCPEYEQRKLDGAHVMTLTMLLHAPYKLSCYYYYYYYYYYKSFQWNIGHRPAFSVFSSVVAAASIFIQLHLSKSLFLFAGVLGCAF